MSLPIEKLYLDGKNPDTYTIVSTDLQFLKELCVTKFDEINEVISELLTKLPHLNTLTIHDSAVTMDSARIIGNFIANSALLKFELLKCKIEDMPFELLMHSVEQSSLRTLNFSNSFFCSAKIMAMVSVLEKSFLTKLSLISCNFVYDRLILIMDTIEGSKLTTLILEDADFGVGDTTIVANCIARSKLTKLSVRHTIFREGAPYIIHNAIKRSLLKTLDVRNAITFNFNTINDLMANQNFTKFKFGECGFSTEEKCALTDSVQENSLLEHISFNGDSSNGDTIFTDRLITKMCDLLQDPRFKSLSFDSCLLPDFASERIMGAIKRSSITNLAFSGYAPHTEKMMAIVNDLLKNYQFEKLKINFLDLEDKVRSVERTLPYIQQSSITKFSARGRYLCMTTPLQNEIELALQTARQRVRNRANTKSARIQHF